MQPESKRNTDNRNNTLVIRTSAEKKLSKNQAAFNRHIRRLEKLRLELEEVTRIYDRKLEFYGRQIYPLEQEFRLHKREELIHLFTYFQNKSLLGKKDRRLLKELIAVSLDEIIDKNNPDADLEKMFEAVNGISVQEAAKDDFDDMKAEMQFTFEQFGFEADLDDLHKDMKPEEFLGKMKQLEEKLKEQEGKFHERKQSRTKIKKKQEAEEKARQVEEARNRNIGRIYKQLAKALHPDLEQDETKKVEKEALMKQLTVAYNNNDLHSILRLEMEWIHKEEKYADKLSDEKLDIYNLVLKEQVEELESEINMILEHPRYQPIRKIFGFFQGLNDEKDTALQREKRDLQKSIKTVKARNGILKNGDAVKQVKEMIKEFEFEKKLMEDDDFEIYY